MIRLTSVVAPVNSLRLASGMTMSSMQIEMPALVASVYPVLRK